MDNGGVYNNSNPVDEVFRDFKGRRAAVIKALTVDVDVFRRMCDPEKENLCLYGHPNGQWEVTLPAEEVPPELPEPVLGINFSRDGMQERDWLSLIAVHSDSWLLSVTSFFGARFAFNKADRLRLFNMMNELPTVLEVVNGEAERLAKRNSSNRSKTKARMVSEPPTKYYTWRKPREEDEEEEDDEDMEEEEEEEEDEDEEEQGTAVCGACGDTGTPGEFWILCDVCEVWFHGKCVRITPARAQHIKHYKCPNCSGNKKTRV